MSTKVNAALDRRTVIRFGAVGAAATAATAATVATASDAEAAAGQAVIQGAVNTVGTAGTTISSSGSAITLTVKNTGAGAAAFFFGQNNNGFAGGTGAANKYGLSAANTGVVGTGAAMAASGGKNTGVLANTNNSDKFAVEAINLGTTGTFDASGGGLYVESETNSPALVAVAPPGIPAVVSVSDVLIFDGHQIAVTQGDAVLFAEMASRAEVSYTETVTLNGFGAAAVTWPATYIASGDLDLAGAKAVVSPNSGPMPGLWITTDANGGISISGGTASGKVTFRVTASRKDVWSWVEPGSRKAATSSLTSAKRAVAAARARTAARD
ncbi:hypothetical protein JNB_05275 [Janibacter sp. HTCC2649]|uniref:hypothetical protein n=1 Tax=Janibacter sp. HTCC2649 TaxID=313589 RepID=UPI000066ED90|nr:hypothetical protein [Janibacter sp. HTCC2649]EAP99557.1 hypothetical protein JNB_05275 [Janibacter sp. HTCC2649]